MTALHTLAMCAVLFASALMLGGAGAVLLRALRVTEASAFDHLLFSLGAGVVLLALAVTLGELAPDVRIGVIFAAAIVAVVGIAGIGAMFSAVSQVVKAIAALQGIERFLAATLFLVLTLQMLAAFAPMTGSDALHYHFTMQAIYLREGFHPPWSLLHGFF